MTIAAYKWWVDLPLLSKPNRPLSPRIGALQMSTTVIDTHVLNPGVLRVWGPADRL